MAASFQAARELVQVPSWTRKEWPRNQNPATDIGRSNSLSLLFSSSHTVGVLFVCLCFGVFFFSFGVIHLIDHQVQFSVLSS